MEWIQLHLQHASGSICVGVFQRKRVVGVAEWLALAVGVVGGGAVVGAAEAVVMRPSSLAITSDNSGRKSGLER